MPCGRGMGPVTSPPERAPLVPGGVMPDHGSRGIGAVVPTLLRHLGAPMAGAPTLAEELLPPHLLDGVERIVFFVVDGLGMRQLQRHAGPGSDLRLRDVLREGHAATLTTTAPSTTATALCTFASGLTPQEHGVLAYTMYAPTLGALVNTIAQRPVLGGPTLPELGLDPDRFFPFRTAHEHLSEAGIPGHALTRNLFVGTPFSNAIYKGIRPEGFLTLPDGLARARRWVRGTPGRGFLRVYHDSLDAVSHATHPDSDEYRAELAALDAALFRELVDPVRDPATLLVVSADHGHLGIPRARTIPLRDHPDLLADLAVPPSGEGRLRYLHARPGRVDAVRDYVERHFAHAGVAIPTEEAVALGLFGRGPAHPELHRRLGDLVLVAREDWFFAYSHTGAKDYPERFGHHGGLHPEEMLVPLLAMRLGDYTRR